MCCDRTNREIIMAALYDKNEIACSLYRIKKRDGIKSKDTRLGWELGTQCMQSVYRHHGGGLSHIGYITRPILPHTCCISRIYTVMAYSETVSFSTVDIECPGSVCCM